MKTIILDPAHGIETLGKRSPDGRHREYRWSRERCKSLYKKLTKLGYNVEFTNRLDSEIGLKNRANIANEISDNSENETLLISLHNDAFGNDWTKATGYSVYTSPGNTKSDLFAEIIMKEFIKEFPNIRKRIDSSDGDLDKEERFTILTDTVCPAVLVEWLFQNNKEDLKKIEDENYNIRYEQCIINAIQKWK